MVVDSNQSGSYGGGIYAYHSRVYLDSMSISRNSSSSSGGIYFYSNGSGNHSLDVSNSIIKHNTGNSGGGLKNSAGIITLTNVQIDNIAQSGGGLYSDSGELNIHKSSFIGNQANDEGGGVNISYPTSLLIENSIIQNNSAYNKVGGIYFYGSNNCFDFKNCFISDNSL